jgi:hypothetical protein
MVAAIITTAFLMVGFIIDAIRKNGTRRLFVVTDRSGDKYYGCDLV